MRKVIGLLVCWMAGVSVLAQDYAPASAYYTLNLTNTFSIGASSTNYATNDISFPLYHTFNISLQSTNGGSVLIERSLTGTNWIAVATNSFSSPGGQGEVTMTGKWKWARVSAVGTNVTAIVTYLGGR